MLNQILVSESFAQETSSTSSNPNQDFSFASFVPLIAIFVIFYFLIIRPQSKKIKEHQLMVNNLKIGNKVVTSGGIIGIVKDVYTKENEVDVEISSGVTVRVMKNHVIEVVNKEKDDKKNN